jgi:serine protease Do
VSPDGYILTNNHVVSGADKLQVLLDRHRSLNATVVGTDPKSDLAVLKVDEHDLPVIRFGDSDELKVGEWVMAVGAPFGLDRSVTVGIVSAKGRSNVGVTGQGGYEDFIQTDAAINHGNSGGALVNMDGELVGVNTAIASSTGGSNGVGFAIPINMAQRIMKSLISEGKVTRGYLGIRIQDVNEKLARAMKLAQDTGVLVSEVTAPGPADKAGMKAGDVIVKLDGQPVDDVADLRNRVASMAPGTEVTVDILRDGVSRTLTIQLTEAPRDEAAGSEGDDTQPGDAGPAGGQEGKLGLELHTLTPEIAGQLKIDETRGVLVTAVASGSPAEEAGVAPNDVVVEVNKQAVTSVDQFRSALKRQASEGTVLLRVLRGNSYLFVVIEM